MLKNVRRVHFVGIGGTGMAPLAQILVEAGFAVQGSDLRANAATARLAAAGARVFEGHSAEQVDGSDLVVISSAVPTSNPELARAIQTGLPVLKRAEVWGELMRQQRAITVAGTHGKTTTTAMIATILTSGGFDPTFMIGGELVQLGTGARLGRGPYLVAEADEYDGSFLKFLPWLAVVTNIEADHLDYYADLDAIVAAFQSFISLLPKDGHAVLYCDDSRVSSLVVPSHVSAATYGFGGAAQWRPADIEPNAAGGNDFTLLHRDNPVGHFSLQLPGRHNVANAVAALAAASIVGVPWTAAKQALASFSGTRRRLELRGCVAGIRVYDDYAHHPTEVRATLAAMRERHPERLVIVFQPHTFHRTKQLMPDFATAFGDADLVVVTDIYLPPGREADTLGITARDLVAAMEHKDVRYAGSLDNAVNLLADELRTGDTLLTMGAGDVSTVAESVLCRLARDVEVGRRDE